MLKWYWDNEKLKVINSDLQSYSIDYVGNLFTDKVGYLIKNIKTYL